MLRLILGTDWVANRQRILGMLAQDVRDESGGRILMVPELISHDTERQLCDLAGDTASRFAEVVPFSRLVRRVSEYCRLAPEKCMDNGGRLVAMAAAVRQMASRLKSYASVETRPEFLTELVDAVDEFKRCCIGPDDLQSAAQRSSGMLAQKLEELSLILRSYDGICAQGQQDPRDQMNWVLEQLECCDFARKHCFYIDGFPDFTRQHMAILNHLICQSALVTVSLNCERVNSDRMAFETAGKTAAELVRCAKEAGIPVEYILVPAGRDSHLAYLRERLFQGRIEPGNVDGALQLWRCDSEYDECMAAAEQIMELVRSGCRYREIGVVCTDMMKYRAVASLVFHRCNIPLYLAGTEDILEKTAVSTLLAALDAALDGLEQKSVLRYLKSVLSPVEQDDCDELENYVILWGIRGGKWLRDWELHPGGLGVDWSEDDRQRLRRINRARQAGMQPLERLRDEFQNARNLSEQVLAVYHFMERIQLAQGLEKLAAELDAQGDNPGAQELMQLWEILMKALEQLNGVLGESVWDGDAFVRLLRLLLSQYDVGTIPPVLDAVTAGPVSAMRCQQVRHLFVLGAAEGSLPGYAGASGVLSDQERVELRRLGVPLTGGAMEGVAAEFAEIYGVFCGAGETVRVFCPAGQSAFVYRRLCDMAGVPDGTAWVPGPGPAAGDPREAGAYLARWGAEQEAQELGLGEYYADAVKKSGYELGSVRQENVEALYGRKLKLSASQIDRQAECRFSYFLRYGLRAKERKEATVDPAEFGTYVHAVLEQTGKKIKALGGWHQIGLEQVQQIARKYSDAYASERFEQLDSQRLAYLLRRNGQELDAVVRELWRELSESAFQPVEFELDFGVGCAMPEVDVSGEKMQAFLLGFVDRVDQWKDAGRNFFRVVDYKTGKKDFDYCDVFNGIGLQMLLYLFALEQGGQAFLGENSTSAGVQYFPARSPILSADGRLTPEKAEEERDKKIRRKGLILADEAVLLAMAPEEEMQRLGCKRKADGTITGDLADSRQMRRLREYVFMLVGRMVDEIASGNVQANPYTRGTEHDACRFCPYEAVCYLQREQGRRNYKAMSAQRFWEEIERQVKRNG